MCGQGLLCHTQLGLLQHLVGHSDPLQHNLSCLAHTPHIQHYAEHIALHQDFHTKTFCMSAQLSHTLWHMLGFLQHKYGSVSSITPATYIVSSGSFLTHSLISRPFILSVLLGSVVPQSARPIPCTDGSFNPPST
jgi:hypothetical protein